MQLSTFKRSAQKTWNQRLIIAFLAIWGAVAMPQIALASNVETDFPAYVKDFNEPVAALTCTLDYEIDEDVDKGLPESQIRYQWTLRAVSGEKDISPYGKRERMEIDTVVPGSTASDNYKYDPSKLTRHTVSEQDYDDIRSDPNNFLIAGTISAPNEEFPEGVFAGLPFTFTKPKLTTLGLQAPKYTAMGFIKFSNVGQVPLQVDSTRNGAKTFNGDCSPPRKRGSQEDARLLKAPYAMVDKR